MKTKLTSLFFFFSLFLFAIDAVHGNSSTLSWAAKSGEIRVQLRGDFLPDYGVKVIESGLERSAVVEQQRLIEGGSLWVFAPVGNYEGFSGGHIDFGTSFSLEFEDRAVSLERLSIRPAEDAGTPVLHFFDELGNHVGRVTHLHVSMDLERSRIQMSNADFIATPTLAEMLGEPALANMPIGMIWLDMVLDIPSGANLSQKGYDYSGRGLSCETRPWWPQDGYELDVELMNIGVIAGQGFEPDSGRLKIAPSATLRNVGTADVPWFPQFSENSLYTHEPRDQHPFLVWNAYRIMDGRIEQLASSGVKHAFFTTNFPCDLNCGSPYVLWPGCVDTYSAGNNDTSTYQGPRDEIVASQGLWDSCGSFFDPNCNDSQSGYAGSWKNRLLVDPAELNYGSQGATYFLDSWYVIQYDVDIWNTMGYHSITPNQGGSGGYTFNPLGPFTQGPQISEWVAEDTTDPMEAHEIIVVPSLTPDEPYPNNMPQGHVRVLAKVHDLGDGTYRYNYAVMNYDLDRGLADFIVPVADGVTVSETWMGGPPDVLQGPWPAYLQPGRVMFSPPRNVIQPWFTLYNFELVTNQPPVANGSVRLTLAGSEAPGTIEVSVPAPGELGDVEPLIFGDRFE